MAKGLKQSSHLLSYLFLVEFLKKCPLSATQVSRFGNSAQLKNSSYAAILRTLAATLRKLFLYGAVKGKDNLFPTADALTNVSGRPRLCLKSNCRFAGAEGSEARKKASKAILRGRITYFSGLPARKTLTALWWQLYKVFNCPLYR